MNKSIKSLFTGLLFISLPAFASDMNLDQSSSISSLQRRRTHRHQLPSSAPGIPSLQDILDGNPTNSEFTFTDSDGGGGLSDEGGVENYIAGPPNLPSMPSTPERFGLSPLSPLHIPDEEGQSSLFPRRESSVMDSPTDLSWDCRTIQVLLWLEILVYKYKS